MKKAVIAIAVAAVAGSIFAGLMVLKRAAEAPPMPVARFVPAETILLAELPDWPRTGVRWRQTALFKLQHEPEVEAFLARPRSKIPGSADRNEAANDLHRVQPGRGFVAVTDITNNMPHAVGGLTFKGERKEMEALIAKARVQARTASPAGRSELLKYKAYEIETFSDKGVTVAGAFAQDWYFVANDTELLKATLDRFTANKDQGTLAGTDLYGKCAVHLPPRPDFRFFVQTSGLVERLVALLSLAGQSIDAQQIAELRKVTAMAGAGRMDGETMRDTLFLLQPGATRLPSLTHQMLKLTSPDTLLYYAFAPVIPDKMQLPSKPVGDPGPEKGPMAEVLGGWRAVLTGLTDEGISVADLKAALGPEGAVISNWNEGRIQPLTNLVAAQVRDRAAALKLVQALFGSWKHEEGDGATYWTMPSSESPMGAAAALTDRYLIFGLDIDSLKATVAKLKAGGDTLEKSSLFSNATASLAKPENTLMYVDSKAAFEKAYGLLRPLVTIWAAFNRNISDYVDAGKLPAPEFIGKHLLPMVLSGSQLEDGTLFESSGTVTLYQAAAVLATAAGAAAIPVLEGKVTLPGLDVFKGANPFGASLLQPVPHASPAPALPIRPSPLPQGSGTSAIHP